MLIFLYFTEQGLASQVKVLSQEDHFVLAGNRIKIQSLGTQTDAAEADEAIYAKGPSDGPSVSGDKSFEAPVAMQKTKLSDQGLYTFNIFSFSPKYNNRYPFYFHSGFV